MIGNISSSHLNPDLKVFQPASGISRPSTLISPVFRADSINISNTIIEKPVYPDPNPPPPPKPPSFFHRPEVRLAGMAIGGAAILGTAGYFAGSALGSAGAGTAIGIGLGVLAPVALLGVAIWMWNKKSN